MAFIELKIRFTKSDPWKDVYTALLSEVGCDSFMDGDNDTELLAYIKEENYDEKVIKELLTQHPYGAVIDFQTQHIEEQNWNAVWEANYAPVIIENQCYIRAPFHPHRPEIPYEILIEPKMSFGTAHHETTYLMITYLLELNLEGKNILDMGAGTGILAILAYKRGAKHCVAIDNDPWAYHNNLENNEHNHITDMDVRLGDANSLTSDDHFDLVIANINRNILLNDMPYYVKTMNKHAHILFSGFYDGKDLEIIKEKAQSLGLTFVNNKVRNQWTAAQFCK